MVQLIARQTLRHTGEMNVESPLESLVQTLSLKEQGWHDALLVALVWIWWRKINKLVLGWV
jgi:hypothetical protein